MAVVAEAEAPARPSRLARRLRRLRRLPAWAPTAALLIAYLALAFALFAPVWAHANAVLIGNQVDSSPHVWFLNWPSYALGHGLNPLVSSYMGAPGGASIAWNTPVFVPGLATWPVNAIAGPVVAFNLVLTLGPALTAFCSYLVCRRFTGSTLAAALGGLLVGFGPYILVHDAAGHSNQVTVLTAPLLLLVFDSLVARQTGSAWQLGAMIGGLAAAQVYISEEMLAGEAVMAVAGLAVLALVAPAALRRTMTRRAVRRLLAGLLAAVPPFLLLAGPLIWVQFRGLGHISGSLRQYNFYVTDLANLVAPTSTQAIAPARAVALSGHYTGNLGEWGGYLGIPLIAAALAVTVWQWRRVVVRWAAAMAVIAVVLSLGPTLHVAGHVTRISLPWRLLGHFPLLNSALPARLMVYAFLFCSVIVAAGIDAALRTRRIPVIGAAAALVALIGVSLFPALPQASRPTAIPAFFTGQAVRSIPEGSVAYILPSVDPEPMLWQVAAGMRFRMLGGWYLGPDAAGHVHDGPVPTPLSEAVADVETSGDVQPLPAAQRALFRAELHRDGVESIVVTSAEPHAAAVARFFQELTGTPPRDDGRGTLYWAGLRF